MRFCELSFREINAAEGKVGLRIEGFERENTPPRVFRLVVGVLPIVNLSKAGPSFKIRRHAYGNEELLLCLG